MLEHNWFLTVQKKMCETEKAKILDAARRFRTHNHPLHETRLNHCTTVAITLPCKLNQYLWRTQFHKFPSFAFFSSSARIQERWVKKLFLANKRCSFTLVEQKIYVLARKQDKE